MERPITPQAFEAIAIRSWAPVLLGAKPANLFTFRGCFVADCPDCSEERCPAAADAEGEADLFAARRRALSHIVAELDEKLAREGVRCRVIAWRPFGALVYAYRPALLECHLGDDDVAGDLLCLGYPACAHARHGRGLRLAVPARRAPFASARDEDFLSACVERLAERFTEQAVPHEVGYFLGYPAADVRGFIEHEGREFLCCGCWKVYGDVRGAQYRFARYKRCTRRAQALFAAGMSLVDLARDPARSRVA
ncbi:DUF3793 family protein [uncultured Enorma sp.]|uniref:DUF3793 family protein n=1 Tax=uncultured Enorma sp. TaxID=1714346 RepID=UPI0025D44F5C|nr:DUF3793 family protein [uncultured Enorma sp.]